MYIYIYIYICVCAHTRGRDNYWIRGLWETKEMRVRGMHLSNTIGTLEVSE